MPIILRFLPILVLAAGLGLPASASAALKPIEIHLTGIELVYDGTDLKSAAFSAGTVGPTQLPSVDFFFNEDHVGTLSEAQSHEVFGDLLLSDVTNIPVAGGLFDGGPGTRFNLGGDATFDVQIGQFYGSVSPGTTVFLTYSAMVDLLNQDLPFGLVIDPNETIAVQFSSNQIDNVSDDGTYVTGFRTRGVATITAMGVPEPGSMLLLASGALAMLRRRAVTPAAE